MAEKISSFSYIATNSSAGVVRGELRAAGQDSALIQLERMGLEPISVTKKQESILDAQVNLLKRSLQRISIILLGSYP